MEKSTGQNWLEKTELILPKKYFEMITQRLKGLSATYQKRGKSNAILKLLRSVVKNLVAVVYRKWEELILCKELTNTPDKVALKGWQIKGLNHDNQQELYTFLKKYHPSKPLKVIENYIRNGYHVFLGYRNDQLIGYMWWHDATTNKSLQHPILQRYHLQLQPDEVYMFDYFIPRVLRRNGNSSHFLLATYDYLLAKGYHKAWGGVTTTNLPARFIYQLHGWKIVGKVKLTEYLSILLISTNKIYLRNFWWNKRHCFDYKFLFDYRN